MAMVTEFVRAGSRVGGEVRHVQPEAAQRRADTGLPAQPALVELLDNLVSVVERGSDLRCGVRGDRSGSPAPPRSGGTVRAFPLVHRRIRLFVVERLSTVRAHIPLHVL